VKRPRRRRWSSRSRRSASALRARGIAALATAVLLGLPAIAESQSPGGAFSPGLPAAPITTSSTTTPTIQTSTSSAAGSGGLSGTGAIAIAAGAVVVLGGISLFIWRDARRRAPVRASASAGVGGRAGSKARTKPRKLSPAERRRRKRGRAR